MKLRRSLLIALLVVLLGLHVFHALFQTGAAGSGGWWEVHGGILGAIVAFFVLSVRDPVLSAGLSDFMVVLLVVGVWMFTELPPAERRRPRTYLWLLSYLLFPGLGLILYFLWLRPDHRVLTGPRTAPAKEVPLNGSPVTALPPAGLDAAAARLAADGYHVVRLDAAGWRDAADMHAALGSALYFPDHYGRNLDALNDALRDVAEGDYGRPAGSAGLALVLDGYDRFARADAATADALLDVWAAAASGPAGAVADGPAGAVADGSTGATGAGSAGATGAGSAGRSDDRLRCLVADPTATADLGTKPGPAATPNRPAGSA